jgi:hypothetical protein
MAMTPTERTMKTERVRERQREEREKKRKSARERAYSMAMTPTESAMKYLPRKIKTEEMILRVPTRRTFRIWYAMFVTPKAHTNKSCVPV